LVGLIRHAETLISLQWYILVLASRLAVYTLFGKTKSNLGKKFCIPKNMHSRTPMVPLNQEVMLYGVSQLSKIWPDHLQCPAFRQRIKKPLELA